MGVTIQEIARTVGVSPSTVSAALSSSCVSQRVSKNRIGQIRTVAEKMGYRPNLSARRLRTGRSHTVGIVVPSYLEHHPLTKYFQLIARLCQENGYNSVPLVTARKASHLTKNLDFLEKHHVDGMIFLGYYRQAYEQYLRMWQNNFPMVFRVLDIALHNVPFGHVLVNHYEAGRTMIRHLQEHGWRDIYFVAEAMLAEEDLTYYVRELPPSGAFRGIQDALIESGSGRLSFV